MIMEICKFYWNAILVVRICTNIHIKKNKSTKYLIQGSIIGRQCSFCVTNNVKIINYDTVLTQCIIPGITHVCYCGLKRAQHEGKHVDIHVPILSISAQAWSRNSLLTIRILVSHGVYWNESDIRIISIQYT